MQIELSALLPPAAANSVQGLDGSFQSTAGKPLSAAAAQAPFSDLLVDSVAQVNVLEEQARSAVTGLMTGTGVDVHQVMIATQKASMAFELSLSIRNKAVQAYQQVMSMQF